MPTARTITVIIVILVLLGFVWKGVAILIPPSPKEFAAESTSGSLIGYRALYELAGWFGTPVTRSEHAPNALFEGHRRVVLLDPDYSALETELGYLAQMESWLRDGGELVVVSNAFEGTETCSVSPDEDEPDTPRKGSCGGGRCGPFSGTGEFLYRLGLYDLTALPPDSGDYEEENWDAWVQQTLWQLRRPAKSYPVYATGTLDSLMDTVCAVQLPDDALHRFSGDDVMQADGALEVITDSGTTAPVVLEFKRGAGRVVLVSEPVLFNNDAIRQEDNAVLAYHLVAGQDGREVVFDEYYHGLPIRGNIAALLVMYPYSIILSGIAFAVLLWAWAISYRFGPPATFRRPMRRNILEYVDAMARLFRRGRKHAFVLKTCRDGLVQELREELHLSHAAQEQWVLRSLERKDRARADRLRNALADADRTLAASGAISLGTLVELDERLMACRKT